MTISYKTLEDLHMSCMVEGYHDRDHFPISGIYMAALNGGVALEEVDNYFYQQGWIFDCEPQISDKRTSR